MQEKDIDIWKRKLEWIAQHGGMALVIVHPDYMRFGGQPADGEYPARFYEEFLEYIKSRYENEYWNALPKDIARFWKDHYSYEIPYNRPKMRVCMLAYSFYDTDARVRRYAETLVRRGDHVDVIALKREGAGQEDHEILNGVHIYRVQKRLLNEKGKLDYLINLVKFFTNSSYHMTKRYLQSPYDLIHVHSVPDFEVFAALLPKLLGAKIILDIHDPVPDLFSAKFGKNGGNNKYIKMLEGIERISTKAANHVITVTDFWKDRIAARSNIADTKISVIMNFPDRSIFHRNGYHVTERVTDNFLLLYPGTLNKHCGLDIAIKAVALVRGDIPSIKFQIYGNGSELNSLKQLVADLGLDQVVSFEKYVPLEYVPRIMLRADVGIALLSGHDEYSQQALNVKLFEFLSVGLPAIATRTKSIELYVDKDAVMLSEPNDPDDVARCIRELYFHVEKCDALVKAGLEFTEKYNSESEMRKYLEIVDTLVR